jgi:hypothetical protein
MAAAAAALALNNQITATADKQLETMYKTVETLKVVGFSKFQEQLKRQAFAYEWGGYILDAAQAVPAPNALTLKAQRDIRNAYLLIMTKCDGHVVENVLSTCAEGDAQAAFEAVRNYFHRNTQAGKTFALKAFSGATMASTNNNVTEWIATVPRLANILIAAGGQADAAAQLSIFLDGLLPEFEVIKVFLDQTANLTYADACKRTLDYVETKGQLELTKNGLKGAKNNTFNFDDTAKPPGRADTPPQSQCRGWPSPTGCRYGVNCKFPHTGPGRLANVNQRWPRVGKSAVKGAEHPANSTATVNNNATVNSLTDSQMERVKGAAQTASSLKSPPSAKCNYCNGPHAMRACPALATDNATGNSNVHMVDGTTGVDYVFMSEQTASPVSSNFNYSTSAYFMLAALMFMIAAATISDPPPNSQSIHQQPCYRAAGCGDGGTLS